MSTVTPLIHTRRSICRLGAADVLALALALALGCARPGADNADSSDAQPPAAAEASLVTVDRESYTARRAASAIELDIVSTFSNRTADSVWLHPCGKSQPSFALEKWVDGAWVPAFSPACTMMLMLHPPAVAAGGSRTDTARVRSYLDANTAPRFSVEAIAGTYRLVYAQAYGSWKANEGPGDLLPLAQRASAPFRIVE